MKPGRVKRQGYNYERNGGTCVVLLSIEPLRGVRVVDIRKRKTKKDYVEFMKELAEKYYSDAEEIIIFQDNLNIQSHEKNSYHYR